MPLMIGIQEQSLQILLFGENYNIEEILQLKKSSIESINNISQEIASNIIEKISGDKLNESSTRAVIEDISKKNIDKYL